MSKKGRVTLEADKISQIDLSLSERQKSSTKKGLRPGVGRKGKKKKKKKQLGPLYGRRSFIPDGIFGFYGNERTTRMA